MTNAIQEFIAENTKRAVSEIVDALLTLPEDKRAWSPGSGARSALNMVAECALANASTVLLIEARHWIDFDMQETWRKRDELASGSWDMLEALLRENTDRFINIVRAVPDEVLTIEIATPYGTGPLSGIVNYPYWNMSYHTGQIYYIGSMLTSE